MTDTTPNPTLDLGPQAAVVARLAEAVTDEQLADPTPCPEYAVRNMLAHLTHLAGAFRDAGRKDLGVTTDTSPGSSLPELGPDWREELPKVLADMAEAWRDPAAWTGMTRAGGVDLPGEVAGLVATDELVIHGWDLARATGRPTPPTRPPSRCATTSSRRPRTPPTAARSSAPSCASRRTRPCWPGRWD